MSSVHTTPSTSKVLEGLNIKQREAVTHVEGPLLIIAGPGSGKTHTLVRRTLYIIEQGIARPEEIVLCTFTEKAALELRDRVRNEAAKLGITNDMSGLIVGTIHGISNDFLDKHIDRTPLGKNFEVLDDLTKLLFVNDNFAEIVDGFEGVNEKGKKAWFGKWTSKWTTIKGVFGNPGIVHYFNRISEEMIDVQNLKRSSDQFLAAIAVAFERYQALLAQGNSVDFEHLQLFFYNLLASEGVGASVRKSVKHVMVDEYQDTNYVQEQLVLQLSSSTGNLCVVGDEDQALYRFRGATVRNILEFPTRVKSCYSVSLDINYRSHKQIVTAYDEYMSATDWSDDKGNRFRFDKSIKADPEGLFNDYSPVLKIEGRDKEDESKKVASFIDHLLRHKVVEDPSQVAILLRSVKSDSSQPYIDALREKGLRAYCPRARKYFELEEVKLLIGSLATVLAFYPDPESHDAESPMGILHQYLADCIRLLEVKIESNPELQKKILYHHTQISDLEPGKTLDLRVADLIYEFLAVAPFTSMINEANQARNIATLSRLLVTFQQYYDYTVITSRNIESLRRNLFNSYLRLLIQDGIDEYEDPDQPFPAGYVPIMTIHQSKGLEFPVVIVGSLNVAERNRLQLERLLKPYCHRGEFEPLDRFSEFDLMRLHYVAYSRAEKILMLTADASDGIDERHLPIWNSAKHWSSEAARSIQGESWDIKPKLPPKKPYSFTGDLKAYETCPRQYQLYRLFEFEPSRAVLITFGLLVHQTIEDIHRRTIEGRGAEVTEQYINDRFEFNYRHLMARATRKMAQEQKEAALQHVMRYWEQNQAEIARVQETEVDVSLEKDDYILHGAIDLVLGDAGTLEVLDFKAQTRPSDEDTEVIRTYYKQLCIYAHILEQRKGITPTKLHIYWTGETDKKRALMTFDYRREDVEEAARHFDVVVRDIRAEKFKVVKVPDQKVCNECDFKPYCESVGTIQPTRRKRRRF